MSCSACPVCLSCFASPVLPWLTRFTCPVLPIPLSLPFCLSVSLLSWLSYPCGLVLEVLSWWCCPNCSWQSCPDGPVLAVLFWRFRYSCPGRSALAVLSCLLSSACPNMPLCSACPVLPIPLCLSRSVCPALPVLFCLSHFACSSGCPVLAIMVVIFYPSLFWLSFFWQHGHVA
jgi:hypothetical protein